MKQFFIITNKVKDPEMLVAHQIEEHLQKKNCSCIIYENTNGTKEETYKYTNPMQIPMGTECILVLGGDGTLLQAARDTVDLQIPLFGINLGTLGFLAEVCRDQIYVALDHLIADEYETERRMMLTGSIFRGHQLIQTDLALNDIVIGKSRGLKALHLTNYVDGAFLNKLHADGIIVSSPTGSTGYNLSVGGPIVAPEASLFVMSPIAPHTINTRSVIFSPESRITVEIGPGHNEKVEEAVVYFDGDSSYPLVTGDRVVITRSGKDTLIVKTYNISFMETLSKKMSAV